jgi:ribosomal protein S18 acetylase RimI-like enzyme
MAAPFQIMPATLAETAEILALERLCYPAPWEEKLIRPFLVAAGLPNKGDLAKVLKQSGTVVAYAFASRQEGQLMVKRLGVHPENRRQGIGFALMVSLVFAAREMKLPAITCFLDEQNLAGQLFLKRGLFKALPITEETRREKKIQFVRSTKG